MTDETLDDVHDGQPTYQWPGVSNEQMASFFASAAAFFRATPWSVMPESRGSIGVELPVAGLEHAAANVMGEQGEAFGVLLFASRDDMESHLDMIEAADDDDVLALPWHMALYFEAGSELIPELRREVGERRWEVEAKQYPWLRVVEGNDARSPNLDELQQMQAVLGAIALRAQELKCKAGPRLPSIHTYAVSTHAGALDVTLEDPLGAREMLRALEAPFSIELSISDADELDALDARLDAYSDQLLARFEASPERATLPASPPTLLQFLLDVTFDACDGGVTHLNADVVRSFLFELMPEHAVVQPAEAAACVKELRAFFEYLQRAHDIHAIEACLAVLNSRVVVDLRKALSVTSKWSPEKKQAMQALTRKR